MPNEHGTCACAEACTTGTGPAVRCPDCGGQVIVVRARAWCIRTYERGCSAFFRLRAGAWVRDQRPDDPKPVPFRIGAYRVLREGLGGIVVKPQGADDRVGLLVKLAIEADRPLVHWTDLHGVHVYGLDPAGRPERLERSMPEQFPPAWIDEALRAGLVAWAVFEFARVEPSPPVEEGAGS